MRAMKAEAALESLKALKEAETPVTPAPTDE